MALNELMRKRVGKILGEYCDNRIPVHVRDQIKLGYGIRGNNVTLFEERPSFKSDEWVKMKIAQFRYNPEDNKWSLYWWRHTGRWYKYEEIEANSDFQVLLDEVEEDPICIFWG
ncbi:DUF3024 domain-containing protein [Orenia marismortui]|uniref:DUF3024 family protein n=1 Tax=Orenia marismortui TaxID=46469 RepID=A0A4R8H4L5_9FIRM|nr:DUF3024 domain-containing protein [Orenia marismortui]TDX51828.1 hypothetical protein C7959_11075 [Orenia marismortui]